MKYFATMFNITRLKLANKRKHKKKKKQKKKKLFRSCRPAVSEVFLKYFNISGT